VKQILNVKHVAFHSVPGPTFFRYSKKSLPLNISKRLASYGRPKAAREACCVTGIKEVQRTRRNLQAIVSS